jgi:hypothetical protein
MMKDGHHSAFLCWDSLQEQNSFCDSAIPESTITTYYQTILGLKT